MRVSCYLLRDIVPGALGTPTYRQKFAVKPQGIL